MLVPKKKDSSPKESESRHYFWLNFFAPARITYLDPTHFENVSFKNEFLPGAHHCEPATTPYSCHGVFADRSIFSLNLSRIQIPTGTSVTNCNHKHGLMWTCSREAALFYPHRRVLTSSENGLFCGKNI